MFNAARVHGRPTIVIAMRTAAITQPNAIHRPPNVIHRRFKTIEVMGISGLSERGKPRACI
jgi:hypothetical protein